MKSDVKKIENTKKLLSYERIKGFYVTGQDTFMGGFHGSLCTALMTLKRMNLRKWYQSSIINQLYKNQYYNWLIEKLYKFYKIGLQRRTDFIH